LVWVVAITFATWHAQAFEVPPLEGRVNDRAGLLSAATEQRLTQRLAAHEQATGAQLAILTVDSLGGVPIEDYSIRVVESWKLGKKGKDDGVLILVAKSDRKMRIEVGYGLEGTLPDITAGRIVRDVMAPRFRQGDYEGGIAQAVEAVIGKTGGTVDPSAGLSASPSTNTDRGQPDTSAKPTKAKPTGILGFVLSIVFGLIKLAFFGIFIVVFLIFSFLGRGGRRGGGGFYIGGGGGGGGGGGFSGGGGSFGGGGASGDW
jgi:uncharacterized protein